jgi:hypothetical protein
MFLDLTLPGVAVGQAAVRPNFALLYIAHLCQTLGLILCGHGGVPARHPIPKATQPKTSRCRFPAARLDDISGVVDE